jgi:DNA mismatch repair protein MutS2
MNPRTLRILEFDKIINKVAGQTSFSGGAELAAALLPSDDLVTIQLWLAQTQEAYNLLGQKADISFGGVHDLRPFLERAERGATLMANELLEIKHTLQRARSLRNLFMRLEQTFPHLYDIAVNLQPCDHVANEIGRCISERGDVLDSASDALGRIRSELRVAQDRLLNTLERIVHSGDVKPYLQDALVTQRGGRYVIPVRAEHKGNVDGIIHDQSSSGATLFIEPLKVVQQNNAVRELELQEEKEVRRILTQLSELVADEADYLRRNTQILAELDFIFAKAKYAYQTEATMPLVLPFNKPRLIEARAEQETDRPPALHPGSILDLRRARHPLLDPVTVVANDIYLDEETYLIVITGPNTGGKTVTLKTAGLLALMAQAGMMIPADEGSKLSVFEGVYADIGDEQSIEQSLSTFSSHMTNIITILEESDPRCLVLLDELGAGTDPEEGSALAIALLDNLRDRGISVFATTHYSDLKLYAHNTPGVRNASVEFNVETLSPTFELSIGLPGRSNALTIAGRLGLNPVIVERAEAIVRPDALEADSLLEEIKRARQEAAETAERTKARERQVQVLERDLRFQLASIEEAKRAVIAETRTLMQQELGDVRSEVEQLRRQARSGFTTGAGGAHEEFLARAEKELVRRQRATEPVRRDVIIPGIHLDSPAGPIEVGDRVFVASLQASGEVLAMYEATQEADVQLGNFRLKLPLKRLELRTKGSKEIQSPRVTITTSSAGSVASPGLELDLRGVRVEAGLEQLERYLSDAYLSRLPWVRIIHGRGTGAMRAAVREVLKDHPLVNNSRYGEANEGGDGVTVVKFVQN